MVKQVWERDKKKIENFKKLGYRCLVFWETDILSNIETIKTQIKDEYIR
jgi:G:T-mismatch repair DNA endonuclease (very short patch repair protein)